ncbi:MAG: hypothetical protein IK100_11580 [Muribaculaceae bacterium]|nr:hypothetical protein [Muribaculaceae bacterium]
MSNLSFQIKKWSIRTFLAVGTLLGLSACHSNKNAVTTTDPGYNRGNGSGVIRQTNVYGPPAGFEEDLQKRKKSEPEPQKLVYGPPPVYYDYGTKVPSRFGGEPIYDQPQKKAPKAKKVNKTNKKAKKAKKVKKNKK